MNTTIHLSPIDAVDEIPSTEFQNAHTKRLPAILKSKGIARLTRYGKTEYVMISPKLYEELRECSKLTASEELSRLHDRYNNLMKAIRSEESANAFDDLSELDGAELGKTVTIGGAY